jgi:hypothetical protein
MVRREGLRTISGLEPATFRFVDQCLGYLHKLNSDKNKEKVVAPVKETENTAIGIRCADHATPFIRKTWY